ncbi:hypothetical protein C2R22_02655 [Salinigranum rubrum]|uniref:Methyltransferase type 11 domain-containing protein n=1 Tax=Salinigranum rubrum TaxID=755307 RepID=A0A2I8VFK9_9EURY|nr:methyltransferase domain-containing protein [Salinigranum rubrum]AUV80691.1 hypothetical protein C2R22_02655 [Salinigranum rubrum]
MVSDSSYEIEDFAFIGRTLPEYRRMLNLDPKSLRGQTVLDCPSGTCSFVAEACARGVDVTGVDRLYDRTPASLARTAARDIARTSAAFAGVEDRFVWEFYDDVSDLRTYREAAASAFLHDYAHHGERYVEASLPHLPFADDAFDVVLSAHFLFLYDDRLSTTFHVDSVRELLRVGRELRVFPLHNLDGSRSSVVETVAETFRDEGRSVTIEPTSFEFQRGANELLRLR